MGTLICEVWSPATLRAFSHLNEAKKRSGVKDSWLKKGLLRDLGKEEERDGGVKRGEGVIIDTGQAVTILQGPAKVKLPPIQLARTSGQ